MIEPAHPKFSVTQQCELLGLPRSSFYYEPRPVSTEQLKLMRAIDELYLAYPFYGSRQMTRALRREGYEVIGRKRVQRLMRLMGLEAIYQKPNLSRPDAAHKIYPYLLRKLAVTRPNQVWAADIIGHGTLEAHAPGLHPAHRLPTGASTREHLAEERDEGDPRGEYAFAPSGTSHQHLGRDKPRHQGSQPIEPVRVIAQALRRLCARHATAQLM